MQIDRWMSSEITVEWDKWNHSGVKKLFNQVCFPMVEANPTKLNFHQFCQYSQFLLSLHLLGLSLYICQKGGIDNILNGLIYNLFIYMYLYYIWMESILYKDNIADIHCEKSLFMCFCTFLWIQLDGPQNLYRELIVFACIFFFLSRSTPFYHLPWTHRGSNHQTFLHCAINTLMLSYCL